MVEPRKAGVDSLLLSNPHVAAPRLPLFVAIKPAVKTLAPLAIRCRPFGTNSTHQFCWHFNRLLAKPQMNCPVDCRKPMDGIAANLAIA